MRLTALVVGVALMSFGVAAAAAEKTSHRSGPNRPDDRVDLLGELLWARAVGPLEHIEAVNGEGKPTTRPTHLLFRFDEGRGLKRSNLTSVRDDLAYSVQFSQFLLSTPGAHNAKIMLGYMNTGWRFSHGDNKDLAHWAERDRVVLFLPVRHGHHKNPADAGEYRISEYGGQTACVIQFRKGELIHYEWFRDPANLHADILFDLYPYLKDVQVGVTQPIFKFEVFENGRWKVCIEPDGRDGLAGGSNDGDFDLVFTEQSKNAKPYSVKLDAPAGFHVSVYSPSADNKRAQILLKLEPFERAAGKALLRPLRVAPLVEGIRLSELPEKLKGAVEETK